MALTVATLCVASAGSLLTYAALHGHGLAWAVSLVTSVLIIVIVSHDVDNRA